MTLPYRLWQLELQRYLVLHGTRGGPLKPLPLSRVSLTPRVSADIGKRITIESEYATVDFVIMTVSIG